MYPIRVEFILELILPLFSPPLDHFTPSGIHPIVRPQPTVDLRHDFPEQQSVLPLLNLVVRHPKRLELHRLIGVGAAVVGNEYETSDLGTTRIETGIGFNVELLAGYNRSIALLVVGAGSVGVDLVFDHCCAARGLVFALHIDGNIEIERIQRRNGIWGWRIRVF